MATYQTNFHGLPVTVNYSTDCGEIEIVSVEWRDIELQDGMNQTELLSLYGEMEMNLQAALYDAADYAQQARIEEQQRRAA